MPHTIPQDATATLVATFFGSVFSFYGVTDVALQELYLSIAGVAMACLCISLVVPKGDRLRSVFNSLCVGSVTGILIISFTPFEYRFYGAGAIAMFASVYWFAPLVTTLRSLFRDRALVGRIVEKRLGGKGEN